MVVVIKKDRQESPKYCKNITLHLMFILGYSLNRSHFFLYLCFVYVVLIFFIVVLLLLFLLHRWGLLPDIDYSNLSQVDLDGTFYAVSNVIGLLAGSRLLLRLKTPVMDGWHFLINKNYQRYAICDVERCKENDLHVEQLTKI